MFFERYAGKKLIEFLSYLISLNGCAFNVTVYNSAGDPLAHSKEPGDFRELMLSYDFYNILNIKQSGTELSVTLFA